MADETVENPLENKPAENDPNEILPQQPVKNHWGFRTQWGNGQPQPSSEAKKAGWAKRKKNQELARTLLGLKFVGQDDSRMGRLFRDRLKTYFGMSAEEIEKIDNESAIMLRLIGSAVEDGDNEAAREIMDRAYGKPTQHIDMNPDEDGKTIFQINVVNVLPDGKQMPEIKTDENEIL